MTGARIQPLGDAALRVELGRSIDPELNRLVRGYCASLERAAIPGVIEWVPGYGAFTAYYLPHVVRYPDLCRRLEMALGSAEAAEPPPGKLVTIPVAYGSDFGPDLEFVAEFHRMSAGEVIELHSRPEYLVYLVGFAPGFPYLGGLSERLATPRLEKPRLSVPAGSVGIGGSQTGVYSVDGPGGWRLVGRTPVPLFEPSKRPPTLIKAGDRVRFRPATREEYLRCETSVRNGTYTVDETRAD